MKNEKKSLAPVINIQCEILILGSMPGEESLRKQEYYAYPQNKFWSIMGEFYSFPIVSNYNKKIEMLLSNRIALWDVLASCERVGSLDSNIKNEKPNDFIKLLSQYTGIKKIFFNGQKAYKSFQKIENLNGLNIELKTLPSTSPAHTISFEKKLKAWRVLLDD